MGMEVTAFTTNASSKEKELRQLGVDHISHSTDLESLKKQEGIYDIILNLIFLDLPD